MATSSDGTIGEVDVLVVGPKGRFLVEIKRPPEDEIVVLVA